MHSFELVLTIVIFVLVGRLIDRWLGTTAVFTVVFTFVGFMGSLASAYYRYMATSKSLDKDQAWARETTPTPVPTQEEVDEGLVVPKGYGQDG